MSLPTFFRKYRVILLHIAAWLVFIAVGTLNKISIDPKTRVNLLDIFFTHLPSIFVFYVSNFIFFTFLSRKKYFLLIGAEAVFFMSYLLLTFADERYITPLIYPGTPYRSITIMKLLIEGFWIFFLYSYFSFGYYFSSRAIEKEKQLRIAESKKSQAEQDKLMAEYSFLRSQINPHFLHNTLSFFYSKSLGASQELSEGILALSDIMRYSLEDGSTNGTVSLQEEIENLKKVIKVNQLRFSNRLHLELSISGYTDSIQIIPLVLITLVENALKHGELTNPQDPVSISIEISDDQQQLHFKIHNRKKTGPKELGHGIGMDNVRKRLEYAYHHNHTLQITDEKDHYTAELIIRYPENQKKLSTKEPLAKKKYSLRHSDNNIIP
jgi:two-component system LytT family sensor kinase